MASGQAIQGAPKGQEAHTALAHDLQRRFFTSGTDQSVSSGAHLYTTKDGVPGMKAALKEAGLPDARFQRDSKTFLVASSSLKLRDAPAMAEILERYGVGSEGHRAWEQERRRDVGQETNLREVLKSHTVRQGGNIDLKAHADGAVMAGLVDQGVAGDTAALVAAENRRRTEAYGNGPRPSPDAVLQGSYDAVQRDPQGVTAAVDAARYEAYGSDVADRLERLDAYVREATAHLGDSVRIGEARPHDEVDNAVSLTVTDRAGNETEWAMRFDVGSSMPNLVRERPENDTLARERFQTAQNAIAPYYSQFKASEISAVAVRNPMDAHGMQIVVSERDSGKPAHDWRVNFAPGSSADMREVLLDGRQVPLRDLREMATERSGVARALAQRLNHEIARKPETMLFIPPSERQEFNALAREKGATARYNQNLQSGYGRPGGYILMGGNPADFAKWQGPEAHSRFVKEGDERRRGTATLQAAAREVVAHANEDPFARYMGVGVKFPSDPEKQQQWKDGYTDGRGRQHAGLKEASPEQLMELAGRTAQSYQALEKEEARIRLEVALQHKTQWRSRYDALPGSHEDKIEALLPREAADKQPGFLAINHNQNRHLWMVRDPENSKGGPVEAGLSREDKLALNSLGRGFAYLRERYEEITQKAMGFTVTGMQRENGSLQNSVDTSVTRMESNVDKFLGGDAPAKGAAPAAAAATAPAPVQAAAASAAPAAAKPAARPAPVRRGGDGLDF